MTNRIREDEMTTKQSEWTEAMIADAKLAVAFYGTNADAVVRFYHGRGWTGQFPWHLF
jgi:hypothetical protein